MSRPFVPKIISANDLLKGDVIYFSSSHTWVRDIADAEIVRTQDEAETLQKSAEQQVLIVDPYLVDIEIKSGRVTPVKSREKFRDRGPSNRSDLGRQAYQAPNFHLVGKMRDAHVSV